MKKLTAIIAIASALALFSACKPKVVEMTGNPIIEGWFADPDIIISGDTYWIYPTGGRGGFCCFSSKDLKNWERHDQILRTDDIDWAFRNMWAPCVVEKDGKFYFYFSANDIHPGDLGGIGVAVSDNPAGPFQDAIGVPLIGDHYNGAQPIDQCVFKDDDGQYYMYYGGWGHCNVVKLGDDLVSIVPFEDGETYKEVTPQGYVEGPFMMKVKGKYYFMWSEGDWQKANYCVAYAISDSPLGPFERIETILKEDPNVGTGAGHHSVLHIPGTNDYYIVYHRHPLNDDIGGHRYICIDKMEFDKNGHIKPVTITVEGIPTITL